MQSLLSQGIYSYGKAVDQLPQTKFGLNPFLVRVSILTLRIKDWQDKSSVMS